VTLFEDSGEAVTIDSDASKFTMNAVDMTSSTVTTGLANIYDATSTTIGSTASAASALSNIQTAIQALADMRAKVGANIQRLNMTDDQVNILNENLASANSRIKDIDVANETTEFARFNILVQSGTSMLTQANLLPQAALQLIT
jgi:flagellin